MEQRERLLCVDDEPRILNFLSRGLSAEGFEVETTTSTGAALRRILGREYDLVVLDLVMPGSGGRGLLKSIRSQRPGLPVLVLSCVGESSTKVDCLELGAADYLEKPFVFDELLARVRLRVRDRVPEVRGQGEDAGPPAAPHLLAIDTPWGHLSVDQVAHVADAGEGPVRLTEREFQLLRELLVRPGETVSKQRLLSSVWGYHFEPESNVVDVCVWRLREKLGRDVVTTVRGRGYRVDVL